MTRQFRSTLPRLFQAFTFVAALLVGFTLALLLSGCGAAPDSTALFADRELEIDRPLEALPELVEAELPPVWEGTAEMFPHDPPADQYHGGYAVAGYPSHGALQDGGETTWAFKAGDEPTALELAAARAAFAELSALLPNWTFVELPAHDATTDIVINLTYGEPNAGCFDALASGSCWFASAGCGSRAGGGVSTGVEGLWVCESFFVKANAPSLEAFAASAELDLLTMWTATLIHEIGHTLGLKHAKRGSGSIMQPGLPIVGWLGRTTPGTFLPCELAKLRGYLPMPGAFAPLEIVNAAECQ